MRKGAIGLAVALVVAGSILAGLRVAQLEREELDTIGQAALAPTAGPSGPEPRVELASAELAQGESVLFEVCIDRATSVLESIAATSPLELVVWRPADQQIVVRTAIDDRLIRQMSSTEGASCATVARGDAVAEAGTYAIEAVWLRGELPAAIAGANARGRIVATRPLGGIDRGIALLIVLGGLGLVLLVLLAGVPQRDAIDGARSTQEWARTALAIGALAVSMIAVAFVPIAGSIAVYGRALAIALVEVGCAFGLAAHDGGSRSVALAFDRPSGPVDAGRFTPALFAVVAPTVGAFLYVLGGRLSNLFPHTGEAPIEAFVSMPSGMLAVAAVAVLAPIAEELFFRGLLFSLIERRAGAIAAFVATTLLFTLVHVPQVWGAWGALASVALVGVGLGGLRAVSGSTAACALAHLVYNSALAVAALG